MELSVKQAIDWVGQQMNELSGDDLASRLAQPKSHSSLLTGKKCEKRKAKRSENSCN